MKVPFLTMSMVLVHLVPCLVLPDTARCAEQTKSSLPDLDIERAELAVALQKATEDNRLLRAALVQAEQRVADMRNGVAVTNSETEVFRRQALELKKRFEALGPGAGGDTARLEQRLLSAVSDLQSLEAEKRKLIETLVRVHEAVARFSKTAINADADAQAMLEGELRHSKHVLGVAPDSAVPAAAVPSTLTDGMVVSVKEELALVVSNLGSKQGVRVGMPFKVLRGDHVVGSVRVVEVRERIAGAVVQSLSSEEDRIKVGDHLKVDAQN